MTGFRYGDHANLISPAIDLIDGQRPDIAAVLRELPIIFGSLPEQAAALYHRAIDDDGNELDAIPFIVVNDCFPLDVDTLAMNLVHEGLHALEDENGTLAKNIDVPDLIEAEVRAYEASARFWQVLYPHGKLARYAMDEDSNMTLTRYQDGTLAPAIRDLYRRRLTNRLGLVAS